MEAGSNLNRLAARSRRPTESHRSLPGRVLLHAQVRAGRHSLDRALANGHPAARSPRLALRAEQLTNRRVRELWSASLRKVVEEFDHPSAPHLSLVIAGQREVLSVWRES